ncbi:Hypothetical protein SCF082_LOCUS15935 [Durusdinium trenchii]|uniref:WW domain-containing protein n=1 Tax=Durusdinium trenchii TaxID=1381693 RepID=A0ABP0K880_9DINO
MVLPSSKRRKTEPPSEWLLAGPDDLDVGTVVMYEAEDGFRRGIIYDTFDAVDNYWVEDEETHMVVRDASDAVVDFQSKQLHVAKPEWLRQFLLEEGEEQTAPDELPNVGVLLIGTKEQMAQIQKHFGPSSTEERTTPQQLLPVPCASCVEGLARCAAEGVDKGLRELGQSFRKDISVAVRVAYLKQVMLKLAEEGLKKLEEYFCLASVHLPFDWDSIKEVEGEEARKRRNLWNQIDLCITAQSEAQSPTESVLHNARICLAEHCGLEVSDHLWEEEVQLEMRRKLQVPNLPVRLQDALGVEVFLLVLPSNATVTFINGALCFGEASVLEVAGAGAGADEAPKEDAKTQPALQDKTVRQWEALQSSEFAHLPRLPAPWLRVRSRSDGGIYFYNKETRKASFVEPRAPAPHAPLAPPRPAPEPVATTTPVPTPAATSNNSLPPGWTQHTSKSNGKVYYFNKEKNVSSYYFPRS